MTCVVPVTKEAASDKSHAMSSATSEGFPVRPRGANLAYISGTDGSGADVDARSGVSMGPLFTHDKVSFGFRSRPDGLDAIPDGLSVSISRISSLTGRHN